MRKIGYQREWEKELSRLDRHGNSERLTPDAADLSELMGTYQVPAVSIAVAGPADQMWCAGHGLTTAGQGEAITPSTIFQACSISKHVAAFGALRLAGDGVIDLDLDIAEYLTSWRLPPADGGWQPRVTVRQLLAHTAGLSYYWFRGYGAGAPVPTFGQILRGEPPANIPPVRQAPEMAGAGLWTTSADLTRLELEIAAAALGESSLLSQELAAQMLTQQVPDGWGLGTEVRGGQLRFGHGGQNIGYTCFSYAWPAAGTAVAVIPGNRPVSEPCGMTRGRHGHRPRQRAVTRRCVPAHCRRRPVRPAPQVRHCVGPARRPPLGRPAPRCATSSYSRITSVSARSARSG
jgi:hypothetical protein